MDRSPPRRRSVSPRPRSPRVRSRSPVHHNRRRPADSDYDGGRHSERRHDDRRRHDERRNGHDRSSRYDDRDDRYYDSRDSRDRRGYHDSRGRNDYQDRRPRRPVNRGTREERESTKTLFIGNLPYEYEDREVTDLVEKYGGKAAKVTVPIDRLTGKNKGHAFVEFESRENAEGVFDKLSDAGEISGRRLRLDWDPGFENKQKNMPPRERNDRPPRRRSPSVDNRRDEPRRSSRASPSPRRR